MLTNKEASDKFVITVKKLEQEGIIKNRRQLATDLDWKETLLSNAMNGHRPVPREKIQELIKKYQLEDFYETSPGSSVVMEDNTGYNVKGTSIKIKLSEIIK